MGHQVNCRTGLCGHRGFLPQSGPAFTTVSFAGLNSSELFSRFTGFLDVIKRNSQTAASIVQGSGGSFNSVTDTALLKRQAAERKRVGSGISVLQTLIPQVEAQERAAVEKGFLQGITDSFNEQFGQREMDLGIREANIETLIGNFGREQEDIERGNIISQSQINMGSSNNNLLLIAAVVAGVFLIG